MSESQLRSVVKGISDEEWLRRRDSLARQILNGEIPPLSYEGDNSLQVFQRDAYFTVMRGDFGGHGPGEKEELLHRYILVRDMTTGVETRYTDVSIESSLSKILRVDPSAIYGKLQGKLRGNSVLYSNIIGPNTERAHPIAVYDCDENWNIKAGLENCDGQIPFGGSKQEQEHARTYLTKLNHVEWEHGISFSLSSESHGIEHTTHGMSYLQFAHKVASGPSSPEFFSFLSNLRAIFEGKYHGDAVVSWSNSAYLPGGNGDIIKVWLLDPEGKPYGGSDRWNATYPFNDVRRYAQLHLQPKGLHYHTCRSIGGVLEFRSFHNPDEAARYWKVNGARFCRVMRGLPSSRRCKTFNNEFKGADGTTFRLSLCVFAGVYDNSHPWNGDIPWGTETAPISRKKPASKASAPVHEGSTAGVMPADMSLKSLSDSLDEFEAKGKDTWEDNVTSSPTLLALSSGLSPTDRPGGTLGRRRLEHSIASSPIARGIQSPFSPQPVQQLWHNTVQRIPPLGSATNPYVL